MSLSDAAAAADLDRLGIDHRRRCLGPDHKADLLSFAVPAKRLAPRRDPVFDTSMLIGVISDTHGQLRPEALAALAGVEHIIHAGDLGSPEIVPRLAKIAPVSAIRGNVDTRAWAQELPAWELVTLAGRTIYVIHDLGELVLDPAAAGFDGSTWHGMRDWRTTPCQS